MRGTRLGQASVRKRREARPELYTVVRVEPVSSESRKIIKLIGKLLKNTSEKHSYNTLWVFVLFSGDLITLLGLIKAEK